jgi:hypothetical protein
MFLWKSLGGAWWRGARTVRPDRAVRPRVEQAEARQLLSGVATVMQNAVQEDRFYVDGSGAVEEEYSINHGPWQGPIAITSPGIAPPGAGIAAVRRLGPVVDVFFVDKAGAVMETVQTNNVPWHYDPWWPITARGETKPGAGIAAVMSYTGNEDDFYVGTAGQVKMVSSRGNGIFPWQSPRSITVPHVAPVGGAIAAAVAELGIRPAGRRKMCFS